MTRLIDADEFKSVFIEKSTEAVCGVKLCKAIISRIDDAPTIDAEPVRHGKWIPYKAYIGKHKDSWVDEVRCSRCRYPFGEPEWKYCPECGAMMDAE